MSPYVLVPVRSVSVQEHATALIMGLLREQRLGIMVAVESPKTPQTVGRQSLHTCWRMFCGSCWHTIHRADEEVGRTTWPATE